MDQCGSLSLLYGAQNVEYSGSTAYDAFTSSYWSLIQENVDPYCIFNFNYQTISLPGSELWGGTRVYTEDQFPAS